MRLELVEYPVKDVKFGKKTGYEKGLLQINKEELLALVLKDSRIVSADLDVAFPGEHTRIIGSGDVIEPRIKVSGPGCVFPGIMGPVRTVGEGRTNRLSGMTIIPSLHYTTSIPSSAAMHPRTAILDMWGAVSKLTPFASTINVVLSLKLVEGLNEWEGHATTQMAEFKVANRLAQTTLADNSGKVEVFELTKVDPSLPKIVYISCNDSVIDAPHPGLAYYGVPIRDTFPTFIHPNELFDGAITSEAIKADGGYFNTWTMMNHPVVMGLYKEHGKRLNFLGVIYQKIMSEAEITQQATSQTAAKMASVMGADGAIVTKGGLSGAAFMETMMTVQACAQQGVKTVFMTPERGGLEGTDPPLIYYVPEAIAMVCAGTVDQQLEMPAPEKVIGAPKGHLIELFAGDVKRDPWGKLKTQQGWRNILGGLDWMGGMNVTCKSY